MINSGSHPATLLGLPTQRSDYPPYVTSVRWSNYSPNNPGDGSYVGLVRQAHSFPITMQPGTTVVIQVTVVHANCGAHGFASIDAVPLRWSAMHVTHTWTMSLGINTDAKPILVCAPASALRHREF